MTGPPLAPSATLRMLAPAATRTASLRGAAAAALMLSAAAHGGALYWAFSSLPSRELAVSAGAPVTVEVVLVQGSGEPSAGADARQGNPEAPESVPDRAVSHEAHAAAPPRQATNGASATTSAQPDSPPSVAMHHAPEPAAEPSDQVPDMAAAPPPPPPRPAHKSGDPATEPIAHAALAEPAHPPAAEPAGTAGGAEGADGSEDGQAAAPRADNPAPDYPYAARLRGQQGRVLLRVEVLPSGAAGAVAVERSSGYESLDRAASETVQRWRFHPALRNGAPVAASVQVPIRFALK